jgi:hypothetical protein
MAIVGIIFDDLKCNSIEVGSMGTWTPVLQFGGANVGITYGVQTGQYTKIGNVVTASMAIQLTSKGSSTGSATIIGLPFPGKSGLFQAAVVQTNAMSFTGNAQCFIDGSSLSTIDLHLNTNGTDTSLTDANFANNTIIFLQITYLI